MSILAVQYIRIWGSWNLDIVGKWWQAHSSGLRQHATERHEPDGVAISNSNNGASSRQEVSWISKKIPVWARPIAAIHQRLLNVFAAEVRHDLDVENYISYKNCSAMKLLELGLRVRKITP